VDDASHQLRTPLTVLRAQLDYLLREPDHNKRQIALNAMSDDLGHAIRATNQLLTLARSDAATAVMEVFDLGDLAREVALGLLPLARGREIDFGVEIASEQLPCKGDRGLLMQALSNIAHNAIQHGRARGIVTLNAAADTLGYCLQVCDDGDGVDPEMLARLGQRFVKSRVSRGSGLGLAIARSVIERHNGRLRLEPTPTGHGLLVTLWWPAP
jgi:two-component system sensor histidine kinase TctE